MTVMKNKINHNSQKATVASNKKLPNDWRTEKVKAYYVYVKKTGKVWSVSTDKEARDEDYRELRANFPKVKLGKLTKTVMRKDLLKKINQNTVF